MTSEQTKRLAAIIGGIAGYLTLWWLSAHFLVLVARPGGIIDRGGFSEAAGPAVIMPFLIGAIAVAAYQGLKATKQWVIGNEPQHLKDRAQAARERSRLPQELIDEAMQELDAMDNTHDH